MWKFSERSIGNLVGVKPILAEITHHALALSAVDFAVIEGVRTLERQKKLFEDGASQTMQSKHLDGSAVDLMAYIGDRASWEIAFYDEIAEAMRMAARERGVALRWGAAWNVPDITKWTGTMEQAYNFYVDARRAAGRRPFIDGPHFELVD
jgi:peptidoglycan L-alanyl-D-glutamate endopeptidase CwlK